MKNIDGGVILLVKLQFSKVADTWNFAKSNTLPWLFFTFSRLNKWYQITHSMTYGGASYYLIIHWT